MKRKLLLLTVLLVSALGIQAQDAGTYYVQNVGNGRWLGPGNNWSTQASTMQHADYWRLSKISDGVYTFESVVSNGGTSYYLTGTYCDGGATNFTLAAVAGKENVYTISNGSGYLNALSNNTVDMSGNGTTESSQWKLYSETEMKALLQNASVNSPVDATWLIKDHDLGRNNRDYSYWSNTGATPPKSSGDFQGATVYSVEAYHATFDVNQTLSNVPNGVYAVRVNGFYRQDGADTNLPYVYGNESQTTLPERTGTENNMQDAAVSFVAGKYLSKAAYVQVTDGILKVGVATTGTSCWAIFKSFHLEYYGSQASVAEVTLAEYVNAYQQALTAAQSYLNTAMFDDDKEALTTAVNNNTLNLNDPSLTQEQLTTATANLNAAAAAAKAAAAQYAYYNNVSQAIAGQTNVDLTSVAPDQNWGFETGNLTSWTSADGGVTANNNNFSGKVGGWFVEKWTWQAHLSNGVLTHDALVLPAGVYTITVNAQNIEQNNNNAAGKGYFLYANNDKVEIGAAGTYTILTNLAADRSELVIKMALEDCTGNWVSCDAFKITYVGEDFPAYTLVTGKMNNDVAAAQTAADAAFVANRTTDNYNALLSAIAAAQASHDAYVRLAESLTVANNTLAATNVYTADELSTFTPILEEAQTGYDQGTITTDNANAMADQIIGKGWHASYKLSDLLISAWDAQNDWTTYYINSWSVEGDGEGTSGMTTPFIEYWTGNDQKLANKTLTATLQNVENGLYEVLAFIRLVNTKTGEGNTGYDGVSLAVNDGDATAFADATQYPDGYAKVIRAEGLVKDGILVIKVDVKDTNVSWLAMKDVKYTKLRDLTEEEMAVAPTSITLDPTEVTLTPDANTATVTPTFEPEDASTTVTWTSSDESVATVVDGVITAVTSGTATITATSTVDETVSATMNVIVEYPETEVISYVNDGPRRTYSAKGENLIKNGSFEYPNGYLGWTNGANGAMSSDNFNIKTDGDNHYLQAKKSEGAGSANSICTLWPIEAGKTYEFGYKVKANSAGNAEYQKVFMTNTAGVEPSGAQVSDNSKAVGTDWTDISYTFTNTGEYQYLQFRARWLANNLSFDDFYLCEISGEPVVVGNVDYITENVPTGNIGTGVFQYSQEAIDDALALVQATPENGYEGAIPDEVYWAYYTMVTLNSPKANQRYAIVVATPDHAKEGNAVVAKMGTSGVNNPTGYGFNASAEPNVNLAQAWGFEGVGEGYINTYKLFYTNENGEYVYLTYGTNNGSAAGWSDSQIQGTTDENAAGLFEIVATNTDNVFNIKNLITGTTIACQNAGNIYTEAGNADFSVQLMEPAVVEVAIAEGAYATRMFPFKPELPYGVVAYEVEEMDNNTLVMVEVDDPQANTPYILYSEEEEIGEDCEGYGTASSLDPVEKGLLVGTLAEQNTVEAGNYVLQTLDGGQKFYKVGSTITNYPAYRAYLKSNGSEVKAINLFNDEPTGINSVTEGAFDFSNIEGVYNVSGAKIGRMQKGMNVVRMKDGSVRKVLVK